MNKEELSRLVSEILAGMAEKPECPEPAVKGGDYRPRDPGPVQQDAGYQDGDFVPDVGDMNLRKLYLTEDPQDPERFRQLKMRTSARLGCGRAGPRYKTLTALRFRADHAAAQDAVFSQIPQDFGEKNNMGEVKTRCESKDQYLTRPDLGRIFDEDTGKKIRQAVPGTPKVQIVIGDGLSSAAIAANAMDCCRAIEDGLKLRNIRFSQPFYVRDCRVGAGDAVGDLTGCQLVCVLVGSVRDW